VIDFAGKFTFCTRLGTLLILIKKVGVAASMFRSGEQKGPVAMSIKLRIVLAAALVLGTASAALAASKHPARHTDRTTVQRNVVAHGRYAYPGRLAYRGYNGYGGFNAYNAYRGYNGYRGFNAYNAYPGYNDYASYYPGVHSAAGLNAYALANYAREGYNAFDYYNTVPRGETYIYIQDKFFARSN
jgi:hypothetical protein